MTANHLSKKALEEPGELLSRVVNARTGLAYIAETIPFREAIFNIGTSAVLYFSADANSILGIACARVHWVIESREIEQTHRIYVSFIAQQECFSDSETVHGVVLRKMVVCERGEEDIHCHLNVLGVLNDHVFTEEHKVAQSGKHLWIHELMSTICEYTLAQS
jgi:hypothetical protein